MLWAVTVPTFWQWVGERRLWGHCAARKIRIQLARSPAHHSGAFVRKRGRFRNCNKKRFPPSTDFEAIKQRPWKTGRATQPSRLGWAEGTFECPLQLTRWLAQDELRWWRPTVRCAQPGEAEKTQRVSRTKTASPATQRQRCESRDQNQRRNCTTTPIPWLSKSYFTLGLRPHAKGHVGPLRGSVCPQRGDFPQKSL